MSEFEIFRFADAPYFETPTQEWFVCGSDEEVVFDGDTYTPDEIAAGAPAHDEGAANQELAIEVDSANAVAQLHIGIPPDDEIWVTIYRGDTSDPAGTLTEYWSGRIYNATSRGALTTLHCHTIFSALEQEIPGGRYHKECRWALYGAGCGVSSSAHQVDVTVQDINPQRWYIVTSSDDTLDDGSYVGGAVEGGDHTCVVESLEVAASNDPGASVTTYDLVLDYPLKGVSVGETLTISRGCDKKRSTCNDIFNNIAHFGGFPMMRPDRNPWGDQ